MELLLSNYPPMKTKCRTFSDMFYSMVPKSTELDIAVGYITSDSLMELQRIVELNTLKALNLTIGMHYLERFTKVEYNAALKLNDFLTENKCGEVRLVTPFRYHGKLYSYSDEQGAFAGIIGSNNLSSIVEGGTRVYESAVFLDDKNMACQINNFIRELVQTSTGNIRDLHIDNFREVNPLLEGHEFVKRVDPHEVAEVMLQRTNISFDIPIKPYEVSPQSNLNAFFGKGREAKNGLVKPRHWYEVELIVPKNITEQNGYPKAKTDDAIFDVITDDGWSFKCKVSLKLISKVLDLVDSETTDWNAKVFKGFINSMLAENSSEQGKIIVRRDRDISKGTGTLLSPNDRKLGDQYDDEVVLTLYKVTGNKGWDGQKIWIPNIKLPGNRVYYSGNDIPEQDNKLCYDILVNTAKVAESTIPYDHNNK